MSNDLEERLAEALGAAADNVVISSGARREAHARRSPSRSRRSVYAVAASAAAVVAIAVAGSLVDDQPAAPPVDSSPTPSLFATPLPLGSGAALLEPCVEWERTAPIEASPAAAAQTGQWTIDAVFEIHLGTTHAAVDIGPDNKQTLRLLPDQAPDTFPLVLAHATDGTRADCWVPHGSGFDPAPPMSDPAYVPGFAQLSGNMGSAVWGTYAQGVARITVTIGDREREASLSHGYFAAVGAPDPADVGVPRPLGWGTAGQVVTAYATNGSVLSRESRNESAVVAGHTCWHRPDGSPLRVQKDVAAYATGTVSSSCGTALPLGR